MIKLEVIKKFAELNPAKVALSDGLNALTWADFYHQTQKIMKVIYNADHSINEFPALFVSKNSVNVVLLGAAMSSLGVPFQGIDYNYQPDVMRTLIKQLNVKHIFLSNDFAYLAESLKEVCQVHLLDEIVTSAINKNELHEEAVNIKPSVFRSYAFTSGTTGLPKIVYRNKSFDARRFDYLEKRYNFTSEDVYLCCMPMYHVSSTGWLRLFLNLGCVVIIHHFVNGYELCEIMNTQRISTTLMSPIMLKLLVDEVSEDLAKRYLASLRFIVTGGKNLPANLKQAAIKKLGQVVYEYYGTTETGVNTLLDPDEAINYPGSVGCEFEGNHIAILDKNNQPVEQGVIGRIAINSYMNMDCYLNSHAETVTINDLTYLLTSDYGYKNSSGYLFVVQRVAKEVNKVFDFYALENEILKLNYVSDVIIFESNSDDGAVINIVPAKYHPYSDISKDLQAISQKYGIVNVTISVVEKLNYTPTGKIRKPINLFI